MLAVAGAADQMVGLLICKGREKSQLVRMERDRLRAKPGLPRWELSSVLVSPPVREES